MKTKLLRKIRRNIHLTSINNEYFVEDMNRVYYDTAYFKTLQRALDEYHQRMKCHWLYQKVNNKRIKAHTIHMLPFFYLP